MVSRILNNTSVRNDLILIAVLSAAVFLIAGHLDLLERLISFLHRHEAWELDEIIVVFIFLAFAMAGFALRRWKEQIEISRDLAQQNQRLQAAMDEIRQLESMLPICCSCKAIRDDSDHWHPLESYISSHSDTQFTHTICPRCQKKLYPELQDDTP